MMEILNISTDLLRMAHAISSLPNVCVQCNVPSRNVDEEMK